MQPFTRHPQICLYMFLSISLAIPLFLFVVAFVCLKKKKKKKKSLFVCFVGLVATPLFLYFMFLSFSFFPFVLAVVCLPGCQLVCLLPSLVGLVSVLHGWVRVWLGFGFLFVCLYVCLLVCLFVCLFVRLFCVVWRRACFLFLVLCCSCVLRLLFHPSEIPASLYLNPDTQISGCGSKLNRRGKPQILVHVSTHHGNPCWNSDFFSHSHIQMGTSHFGVEHSFLTNFGVDQYRVLTHSHILLKWPWVKVPYQ